MYNKKVLTEATRNLNKVKVRVKKRPPANQDNIISSRSELDAFAYPTMDNTSLMKEGGEKQFVNSKEHGVDAPEYFQVQTAESPIHGTGVFTNEVIPAGSPIGVTHIRKTFEQNGNTYKAPFPAKVLGGYNHSENPNVTEVDNGDHIVMVALRDIQPGEELVSNYNDNIIEDLEKPEDFKNELTKANMGLITKGVKPVLKLATHKNPAKRFIGQRLVDAGVTTLPRMFPDQLRDLGIRAGHLSQGTATFDLEDLLENLSGSNTGDDFTNYIGFSLDTYPDFPDFNVFNKEDIMRFNPDYFPYGTGKRDLVDLYFTGKDESFKEAPWLSHLEGAGSLDKYTKIHGPLKSYELQSLIPHNKPISGFDLFESLDIANPKYSAKERAQLKEDWSTQGVDTDYQKTGPKRILSPTHYSDFDKWKYKYLTEAAQSGDKEKIIRGFNKLFDRYGDVIPFETGADINQPAPFTFAREIVKPMDDIAGHMKYLRRISPTQFDLTTRDVWGFHPIDYNKKWGIQNHKGVKDKGKEQFELRNRDYIRSLGPRFFTKLGNPFVLTQTNPLSFSPEMWKFKKKGGAVKQLPKANKGLGKVIEGVAKTSKPLSKQLTLPLDFTSNISKLTHGISPEQMQMIQSKFNVPIEPNPPTYTDFLNLVNSKLDKGIGIKKTPINLKLALDKPNLLPDKLFTGNDYYLFDVLTDLNTPGKFDKIGEIDLERFTQDPDRKTFEKVMDYPFKHLPSSSQSKFKGLGISGELNKGLTDALQFYGMNPLLSSNQHTAEGLKRWKYLESIGAARRVIGSWETPRWELLSWALPLIGTGVGAYGLSNPWQQEQPNYLLNRRHGGSTGQPPINYAGNEELPKAQMGVIGQQASNERKGDVYPFLSYRAGDSYPTAGVEYIKGFPTRDRRLKHSAAAGIYGSPEKIGTGLRYSSKYRQPNKPFNALFDAYGGYGTDQGFYTGFGAYPMFNIVDRKDASFSAGPYLGYEMQTKLPEGIVSAIHSTEDPYFADPQSLPLAERIPLSSGFRYGAGAEGRFKDFYGKAKFWFDPVQGKLSDSTSDNPIIKTYQEKVGTGQLHFKPSFEISAGYNIPIDAGKSKIKKQIEKRKTWENLKPEHKTYKFQDGGATTPEEWEQEIRVVEAQIGNPSGWTLQDYNLLQNKLNDYRSWRENTPEGQAVIDSHNVEGEYNIPLPEHLQNYTNAMMKARLAYANEFGNPAAQRMIVVPDQPYDFGNGYTGTHYMSSIDNYAVPQIQDENGQLVLGDYGPESNEAIRFDNPDDAQYFAEHYKEGSPGFMELELTDDEIDEYVKGGYIVEKLPKARYGLSKSAKNLGRIANIGTIGTANTLAKTLAPIMINPAKFLTMGAGYDGLGPFTGSPLNFLPFYGKDLSEYVNDTAFRKFGDTLDYVKLSGQLDPSAGPLLRIGKSQIKEEGNWAQPGVPNESYRGVFGARFDTRVPGSDLGYISLPRRNGVLITDAQGNSKPSIPISDPGLTFHRRLPFSNRYIPVNMETLRNDQFDPTTMGGNLQSLIERYGYAALGVAGLGAMGYNTPQEYLDEYVTDPLMQGYDKLYDFLKPLDNKAEELLINPWKKQKGGGVNIGDEVDEATMQRLINEGYTFEEL